MEVTQCTLCNLCKNLPDLTTPIPTYGNGDLLFVNEQPDKTSIMAGQPYDIQYDFISKICSKLNISFRYTYILRCCGEYSKINVLTCKRWFYSDVYKFRPNKILFLGQSYNMLYGLKKQMKYLHGKIVEVGRPILSAENIKAKILYSPTYVMKRSQKDYDKYVEHIKEFTTKYEKINL